MKPVSTFDNFPPFANAGTRNAPGDAKYSLGFVPADTLPAEWANYFFHGSTKGVTDLNSAVRSIWQELQSVLTAYGITPSSESTEQILEALNKIYPKFASCSTAASTQTKVIAVTENLLKAGNLYVIDMENGNGYGDGETTYPMLSINSGTAYPICDASGKYAKAGSWQAGQTVKLLFTGSKFLMSAGITDALTQGNQNAPTADSVARAIAGIGASIVGEIKIWPALILPGSNWMICDGRELSRTEYAALFAVLGVTWGIGDGVTTFNIPDLRETSLVGAGQNTTDVFDSTETDPNTGVAGTQSHDVYAVGEFKDDQLQNITGTMYSQNWSSWPPDGSGAFKSTYVSASLLNHASGQTNRWANSFDASRVARAGDVTRGKRKGVNYIIRVA